MSSEREGDALAGRAQDRIDCVYRHLRDIARVRISRLQPGQTLQATALVHEAYVRLVAREDREWESDGQFFAAAAVAMRDIVVERARKRECARHGGGMKRAGESMIAEIGANDETALDVIALDDVLELMKSEYPRAHQLVMLRYYAGLEAEQAAEAMEVSLRTVERDWRFAKAWLHKALSAG